MFREGYGIAGLVLGILVGLIWIGLFTWAFVAGFTHSSFPFTGEALFETAPYT